MKLPSIRLVEGIYIVVVLLVLVSVPCPLTPSFPSVPSLFLLFVACSLIRFLVEWKFTINYFHWKCGVSSPSQ